MMLPPPTQFSDLRSWMRKATADDLMSWLVRQNDDYRMLAPIGKFFGARIREFPTSDHPRLVVDYKSTPEFLNPWDNLHGGVLLGLIDEVSSTAAAFLVGPKNFGATTTIANSFIRPVRNATFSVAAEFVGRSLTSLSMRSKVIGQNDLVHNDALVNFSIRSALKVADGADHGE